MTIFLVLIGIWVSFKASALRVCFIGSDGRMAIEKAFQALPARIDSTHILVRSYHFLKKQISDIVWKIS
jgi:hypothetical protein